ncbi:rRNA maturation RNase YbeY [Acidobacteria bacterium AH-259-D05]|nr:rRNA maturation RNase YbeY [Acidobacteria bacterium AH-259-D05]
MAVPTAFSVVLISDAVMRNYNRQFSGQNRATDVLAFPDEDGEEESYLGDILICVDAADRQRKKTLLEELKLLCLHGLLHLLGYDHHADGGEMQALDRKLRREFQLH